MKLTKFKAQSAKTRSTESLIPQLIVHTRHNTLAINKAAAKLLNLSDYSDTKEVEYKDNNGETKTKQVAKVACMLGLVFNEEATCREEMYVLVKGEDLASINPNAAAASVRPKGEFSFSGAWGALVMGDPNYDMVSDKDLEAKGLIERSNNGTIYMKEDKMVFTLAKEMFDDMPYAYIVKEEAPESVEENTDFEEGVNEEGVNEEL